MMAIVVSLLDSDSDDEVRVKEVTPIKRRKVEHRQGQAAGVPRAARQLVVEESKPIEKVISLSSSDDDASDIDDIEVQHQLEQDPVLRKAQELLRKVQSPSHAASNDYAAAPYATSLALATILIHRACRTIASNGSNVISLDSDDESKPPAPLSATPGLLTLHLHWTTEDGGRKKDTLTMRETDAFQGLLDQFCAKYRAPVDATRFVFDAAPLPPFENPKDMEVEDGDSIDVIVDWHRAKVAKAADNAIRIKIRRRGTKKKDVFTIAPELHIAKLLASFCSIHNLRPDEVVLKFLGEVMQLDRTVESYLLDDNDVVDAETSVAQELEPDDPNTVKVSVRLSPKETETHRIVLAAKVETLVAKLCAKLNVEASQIQLQIDGEAMHPQQPFTTYDLEGDELIDVTVLR
ncbi:Aste57867_17465 [Aphanomyces stellatus]|uniref:Aste57867_17465 protein n=1 Tax=Aphanomyces stellatus TaxID=120398 RepID=A0A485L8Q2_9STRA|nr:hypothetical protein As57867_017405 [Aphanomyces stellatus]VFT94219.1 Aste57867_17465 [Aphanomyces stellatus]